MSVLKVVQGKWGVGSMSNKHFLETNHKWIVTGGNCGVVARVEGIGDVYENTAKLIAEAPEMLRLLAIAVQRMALRLPTKSMDQLPWGEIDDTLFGDIAMVLERIGGEDFPLACAEDPSVAEVAK